MVMLLYASSMCILALPGPLQAGFLTASSAAIPKTLNAEAQPFITRLTSVESSKETNAAITAVSAHPAAVIILRMGWPLDTVITLVPLVTKSCCPVTTTTQWHFKARAWAGMRALSELSQLSTPFWPPSVERNINLFKQLFVSKGLDKKYCGVSQRREGVGQQLEPLLRGGSFNVQLSIGDELSSFITGTGTCWTQQTTGITPSCKEQI